MRFTLPALKVVLPLAHFGHHAVFGDKQCGNAGTIFGQARQPIPQPPELCEIGASGSAKLVFNVLL
jgi:hypothetical protein